VRICVRGGLWPFFLSGRAIHWRNGGRCRKKTKKNIYQQKDQKKYICLRAEFEFAIPSGSSGSSEARMRAGLPAGAEPSGRHDGVEPCSVMWGALWVQNPG
jgi:hypothetical protein